MSTLSAFGHASLAVLKRDVLVFLTYRSRLVGQLLGILFALTVFYYVSRLVRVEQFPTPQDYFAFALVGIVMLRTLLSTFGSYSTTLRQELVAGTFERVAASPFGPTAGVVAMLIFPFGLALFVASVTILLGALIFGAPLSWATLPLALPVALLTVLAFAPFTLIMGASVIAFKQAAGAGLFIALIGLVSGLIFPVDLLPGWIRWASDVQPFTPAVDLLRHLIVGVPLQEPVGVALLKITGFVVVLLPLSLFVIQRAIDTGRRRGTLTEY